MGTNISSDFIAGKAQGEKQKTKNNEGWRLSLLKEEGGHRTWPEDKLGSRESTVRCGKVMREWGPRLRLKRGMKIMQRDQSAKSSLLLYHCNSGFGKESIYIQLPLSLWRLILGGCGLIYEIKLVKIELRALMVPFNMIFSLPASILWCPWGCSSPFHRIPDPQRQELREQQCPSSICSTIATVT